MPRLSGTRSGQAIYVLLIVRRNAALRRLGLGFDGLAKLGGKVTRLVGFGQVAAF
ncbi:MAG: hypothetical protein RL217_879 [Pseudomonadota bacterium]|jgi:hypothetical protein